MRILKEKLPDLENHICQAFLFVGTIFKGMTDNIARLHFSKPFVDWQSEMVRGFECNDTSKFQGWEGAPREEPGYSYRPST
ncbi:MAG: hypothetical protein WDM91_23830 [Rhizomicrobium sp.]